MARRVRRDGRIAWPSSGSLTGCLWHAACSRARDPTNRRIGRSDVRCLPILLTQTPTKCRVRPVARIKLGKGWRFHGTRDSEQGTERVERVETPVEAERKLVEVGL